ncbi:hypothetical protein LOK49_LG15G00504 [Camellia lanceoleosa]|uniref:Uncharacterized protein n=1 Tax=Camellia lanceoleosa TaxID=1840588 RepID=A0ACC0F2Z3_9ERIC|nr:hypothetical protein LOK49_LG15G00504 [Camellia lanceoleosa]
MATGLEGCNASKIVYDVLPSNHLVIGSACVFENPTSFDFHGFAGFGCDAALKDPMGHFGSIKNPIKSWRYRVGHGLFGGVKNELQFSNYPWIFSPKFQIPRTQEESKTCFHVKKLPNIFLGDSMEKEKRKKKEKKKIQEKRRKEVV